MAKVAIIGSGSWGSALGIYLANQGNDVKLWSFNEDEKNLYYVVCTRAQHQLIIYNQPELTLEKPKVLTKTNLKR